MQSKTIHEVLDEIYLDNEYAYNLPLMAAVLKRVIDILKEAFPEEARSYDSSTQVVLSKDEVKAIYLENCSDCGIGCREKPLCCSCYMRPIRAAMEADHD